MAPASTSAAPAAASSSSKAPQASPKKVPAPAAAPPPAAVGAPAAAAGEKAPAAAAPAAPAEVKAAAAVPAKPAGEVKDIEIDQVANLEALAAMDPERLKKALAVRGLKCGGTIQQRAERLWSVKGLAMQDWPASAVAPAPKPAKK
mmetsp:Transcript_4718/g.11637  ORF Transcript_4718/g.11637 Transcript_4718/m.11637 type:complete len:146 (+) Transcript_4718:888-1325(+)